MNNNNYKKKNIKKRIKYLILLILFCLNSSILCYSQEETDFDIFKKLSYPNVLRISVKSIDHHLVIYYEEYFIYFKYTERGDLSQLKIHILITNFNVPRMNIDTVFVLTKAQEEKNLSHFCNFISNYKIPEEYIGELEPEPSGVLITYTMEVAGEKYTFKDRRLLSLATLILFNKNN